MHRASTSIAAAGLLALAMPVSAQQWTTVATLDAATERLSVRMCTDQEVPAVRFVAASGRAGDWLRTLARSSGRSLQSHRGGWRAERWQAGECLLTEVDLGAAAERDRHGIGHARGRFIRVSPDEWWWKPYPMHPDSTIAFDLPDGWSASVPWQPLSTATRERTGVANRQDESASTNPESRIPNPSSVHRFGGTSNAWPLTTAFGRFEERALALPGGTLRVAVLPLAEPQAIDALHAWIRSVAGDLLTSSGRLPVADAQVLVVPLPGVSEPVPWGEVIRGGGPAVHLFVGVDAGPRRWRDDWTATHEFSHLLHPYLDGSGRWLAEGLASYYQNVLRARSGALTVAQAWRNLDAGFDRGRRSTSTDGTPIVEVSRNRTRGSTMRIYWSGAAFWLEADVALRMHGSSLDAVLAQFSRRHMPSERQWAPGAFVAALHALAPGAGLNALYARHAAARAFPDLAATYARLGLPDARDAPDAAIRRAIMARQGPAP